MASAVRARRRLVAGLEAGVQRLVVRVPDHHGVQDGVRVVRNVDQLSIFDFGESFLHLFVVANGFEDGASACWLHLYLVSLAEDDLAVEVDLRNHALAEEGDLVLVGAEVVVFLKEELCFEEVLVAGHYEQLALLVLLL